MRTEAITVESEDQLKSYLAEIIVTKLKTTKGTQEKKAALTGLTQPRLSNLTKYRINLFSVTRLLKVCIKLNISIQVSQT